MRKKLPALLLCLTLLGLMVCGCGQKENAAEENNQEKSAVELTADYLKDNVNADNIGSLNGDWIVIAFARSNCDMEQSFYDNYYAAVEEKVITAQGILDATKYTEYSRTILALTAIGKDPADVGGYNLLVPLGDFNKTIAQGLNGPIWALIALDSGNYEIPTNAEAEVQASRDLYLQELLGRQLEDGGFALSASETEADIDITAMALQALAAYADQAEVAAAIEKGVTYLSEAQGESGGYMYWDVENCESDAQVITAMAALGIDLEDQRFVKNGNSVLDHMLTFRLEDGSFFHTTDIQETNLMATEQAFYGLVATERVEQGKSALFTMAE